MMTLEERSRRRFETMETHRTTSFSEADQWDLEYWQRRTPEERLSAFVALRREVEMVEAAKREASGRDG